MSQPKSIKTSKRRPEQSLGFVFWQLTNLWQRKLSQVLKPLNLTHVQFVLLAGIGWLHQSGEKTTQIALARHAKTDVMMTSKVLRALEQKQLVERQTDSYDTRAKTLKLTAAGTRLLQKATDMAEMADIAFFVKLGQSETKFHQTLLTLLESQQEAK